MVWHFAEKEWKLQWDNLTSLERKYLKLQNYDNLGQVFKNLRTNRHISLKQISNERVSAAQISRFERGESDISLEKFLIALALCGVGLAAITVFAVLGLPAVVIVSGNLVFEFFLTIFNIHFFSMVQKKMPKNMLGRVFSSIFTVAVIFMPISTAIMTALPISISIYAFAVIGVGILLVSGGVFFYSKKVLG